MLDVKLVNAHLWSCMFFFDRNNEVSGLSNWFVVVTISSFALEKQEYKAKHCRNVLGQKN